VAIGLSDRALASGAIAPRAGGTAVAAIGARAAASNTSGKLENETPGIDAAARSPMPVMCRLSMDDRVGTSASAKRCTAGGAAIDESVAGSGEEVALNWAAGAAGGTIGRSSTEGASIAD
jgi:hypothetical protein